MFKLDPPDAKMQAELRSAANSAARRPADPRYVTFYLRPKEDEEASLTEGRPIYRDVEYVVVLCPGDPDTVIDRPVSKFDRYAWQQKYTAFRNNLSQEINGLPLEKWGGVPGSRVAEYAHAQIKTVEQLAEVPDSALASLGRGARGDRDKAKNYLSVMAGNAPMADVQAENERLRAESSAMAERLAALEALAARSNPGSNYDGTTGLPTEPTPKPAKGGKS